MIRREFLDQTLFWTVVELENKLGAFRQYYNHSRVHASLEGHTPAQLSGESKPGQGDLEYYRWRAHCPKTVESDLTKMCWNRTKIDLFDYSSKNGEGAGHHVVTYDFDGDGNDEFIVSERGPEPFQGAFYYKITLDHPAKGVRPTISFERTQISSSSAARIALQDFDEDGLMDFAMTGYYTPGYFLAENPQVLVFLNRRQQQ